MADQDRLVSEQAEMFAAWDAVLKLAYVTGVLDAWYLIKRSGEPEEWLFDCLYGGGETSMTRLAIQIFATEAAREAKDAGRGDVSAVDALVPKLKEVCAARKKLDGADSK
ncbi:MAG: hypothetical protein H6907_17960 [Hyphomicrobiales bacterium]|nr:hypothetical protein [Hyphomicrobiales bacterium]MCP5373619.1 hypothetical protein [Hyphomicrobiales bacterium]